MVRLVTNSLGPCVVCHKPVYLGDVPFFYIPDENGGSAWHGECRVWLPLDVQECRESLPVDDKPPSVREGDGANP